MKNITIFLCALGIVFSPALHAQVAISTDNSAPHSSAMLEVKSTEKGILVPRLTTTQRTGITGAAEGLLVYDSDTDSFWFYSGSAWQELRKGAIPEMTDSDNDTKVVLEKTTDEDTIRFSVAGAERMLLTNNRLELYPGNFNVMVGPKTGQSITSGEYNAFYGYHSGISNTTGSNNVAFGNAALSMNTVISDLVAVGDSALSKNGIGATGPFEGEKNTALGFRALAHNTDGYFNTATGYNALYSNISGCVNTAIGTTSLYHNTSGYYNIAIGVDALFTNTTGWSNTAIGHESLFRNSTGYSNVAIGNVALRNNYNRSCLVAVGDSALYSNGLNATESYHATGNTALGSNSLALNSTGYYNTAAGYHALYSNTSGHSNIGIGYNAGHNLTEGNNNILIGFQAGDNLTTGTKNIIIGYDIDARTINGQEQMILGDHELFYGDITNKEIGIGTTFPEGELHIENTNDALLIIDADSGNFVGNENYNPRLELRQDGEAVIGAMGFIGEDEAIYNNSIANALYLVNEFGSPLQFGTSDSVSMTMLANGKVGIATTEPTQMLDVDGNARFRHVVTTGYTYPLSLTSQGSLTTDASDIRLKTNIETLNGGLDKVMKLRGVEFNWKSEPEREMIGFIAQEVEQVVPELVFTNPTDGYKGVNYAEMAAVLVEAMKEQQMMIEVQQKSIRELQSRINALEAK